jgi:hypothetical protein
MNLNLNPSPASARANGNANLLSSPSTELIQRALTKRIWSLAESPNGDPIVTPQPSVTNTVTQVSYAWCAGFLGISITA